MRDAVVLALACAAGIGLGVLYFGGLWLTVRRLPAARHPALMSLASFLARTAVTVVGIFLVMGDRWERAAACLAGLLVARMILVRRLRPACPEPAPPPDEVDNDAS